MLFPTIDFFIFFIIVFTATWALNAFNSPKKLMLLVASYFFYAQWNVYFIFLLAGVSASNFIIGYAIGRLRGHPVERVILLSGIMVNVLTLAYFKYYDFLSIQIYNFFIPWGIRLDLGATGVALPVAISFLAFHGISYIVDIHRERVKASTSLVDVMLYMAFFPHLVAGPIVRAAEFFPQLATSRNPASINLGASLLLIIGGLVKKVIIAGYLSQFLVDPVFNSPASYATVDLVAAVIAYAVVIYCDFSGYTDIAIGVANLLGYHFPMNFNQPYRALSLQDFWRRWHITLSTWLRDYVYIPLGGSHSGSFATYRNLLLTMLLGGVWHGAGAQFVIWGALHGAGLAIERFLSRLNMIQAQSHFIIIPGKWLLTFTFVNFAWIFFRAPSVEAGLEFITCIGSSEVEGAILSPMLAGLILFGLFLHVIPSTIQKYLSDFLASLSAPMLAAIVTASILSISIIAPPGVPPFIYFQF